MSISKDEVARVARLAYLDLDAEEAAGMARDLGAILAYAARLPETEARNAPPPAGTATVLREDRVVPGLEPGEATAPAPEREGNLFRVPPVLGGE